MKSGQNPISGLGGDVVWRNCLWTHGHETKCDHKSSPCHYVTGELKTEWQKVYKLCAILFLILFTETPSYNKMEESNTEIQGERVVNRLIAYVKLEDYTTLPSTCECCTYT